MAKHIQIQASSPRRTPSKSAISTFSSRRAGTLPGLDITALAQTVPQSAFEKGGSKKKQNKQTQPSANHLNSDANMSAHDDLMADLRDDDDLAQLEDDFHEEQEGPGETNETDELGELEETHQTGDSTDFDRSISTADELNRLHKVLRDHYSVRFPELETLVTTPIKYAKTVAILQNGPLHDIKTLAATSDNMVGAPLKSVLDGPSLMVVAVEGTTTQGREMTDAELQKVVRICERILKLDRERIALTESIQSRMNETAPNLAALIGPETAAQFLNSTGGLKQLSAIPSCNLGAIGAGRQEGTGFATNHGVRSKGFLYYSPLMEDVPMDLRQKLIRTIAAKMVLATRVDVAEQNKDGSYGQELREKIYEQVEKLTEANPNSGTKALPAPDDKPSRKRGGWRARKAKEATAQTELSKAQNRVAFGKEEAEVGYGTGPGTKGLGMLGQQNDGRIRATQIDKRTQAKLSKNNKGWGTTTPANGNAAMAHFAPGASGTASVLHARGLRASGVGSQTGAAGTSSTIAFTPVQGLELVDPKVHAELKRKREAEENRWFKSGTFTQAPNNSGEKGGFKVPALPPKKKVDTGDGKMGPPPRQ
jgi:U4/U6 small nuclear ribonucleoprotein PRP31